MKKDNVKIFIISGKARTGKDTLENMMKDIYENKNKSVMCLQYAYYLKLYAERITGWDGSEDTKPRNFLQQLGTEIIRNEIDEDFFVNRVIEDIKVYSYFYDIIIIEDARFKNEIDNIKTIFKDAIVIRIERPNFKSDLTDYQQKHPTEIDLDGYNKYDYIINNDGTLEDLRKKIEDLVESDFSEY